MGRKRLEHEAMDRYYRRDAAGLASELGWILTDYADGVVAETTGPGYSFSMAFRDHRETAAYLDGIRTGKTWDDYTAHTARCARLQDQYERNQP